MRQKGFIQLSALAYGAIAAGVVIAGLMVALKVQTSRLESTKAEYATFKDKVEFEGRAAQKAADERHARELKAKDEANANQKRLTADLAATVKRLRAQHASSSLVSAAAPAAKRPDLACYDRAELTSALRVYEGEVESFLAEGGAATVDLNAAKAWAKSLQ